MMRVAYTSLKHWVAVDASMIVILWGIWRYAHNWATKIDQSSIFQPYAGTLIRLYDKASELVQ